MTTTNKPITSYWIIAVIALLWNLMGLFQFFSYTFMAEEIAQQFTDSERTLMDSLPSWYNLVFGLAVITGFLGCVMLLLRRKMAIPLFLISLIAVLVQMGYWLFITDVIAVMGVEAVVMPLIVIIIAIFLYYYSKGARNKGWLR